MAASRSRVVGNVVDVPDDRLHGDAVPIATASRDGHDPWAVGVDEVADRFGVHPADGLDVADAAERLAAMGPNELTPAEEVPWWRRLAVQFADPLVALLLVAIAISLTAWALEGAEEVPFEAIVIAVIVVANAVIGLWQEARAEAAVAALAKLAAPTARVRRNGKVCDVATREVVPGDVLLLAEGDAVCADARLVEAATLQVAEASLTGESEAVLKDTDVITGPTVGLGDRTNMVFAGTAVSRGSWRASSPPPAWTPRSGASPRCSEKPRRSRRPLQREIDAGRPDARHRRDRHRPRGGRRDPPDLGHRDRQRRRRRAAASGCRWRWPPCPRACPAILTVVLALGVQRMAERNAIVKKLSSVETLGSASVICSDKTGTLTRNEMTIERSSPHRARLDVTGDRLSARRRAPR